MEVVLLTEAAIQKASALLEAEKAKKPEAGEAGLAIGVIGGGCSGLQYALNFRNPTEDDLVHTYESGLRVIVDPKSAVFLQGTTIDFHDSLEQSGFEIQNPNARNSCGCNRSFGV